MENMSISELIIKAVENHKFCYARKGGEGFVDKHECICTKDKPCQSILDRRRFVEAFKDIKTEDLPKYRNEVLQKISPEFEDSEWWKDNVKA